MRSIVFNLRPDTDGEKKEDLFSRLGRLKGIAQAGCLSPHAKDAELRRMCFAYVADDADLEGLLTHLRQQPEVEQASVPAQRGLA